MASWYEELAIAGMPVAMGIVGARLRDRDKNETGGDDAWGRLLLVMAPFAPQMVAGGTGANATLKAMRAIEKVAHQYRVEVGDVPKEDEG